MTLILDYGVGNLQSVQNALRALGEESGVSADPQALRQADRVVLPGVGAFKPARSRLMPFDSALHEFVESGRPLLGLCLGMQLLFTKSHEDGESEGLSLFVGEVLPLPTEAEGRPVRVPHIGWTPLEGVRGPLFEGLKDGDCVYFAHSYAVLDCEACAARATHGTTFCAAVSRENVHATQFHPEKSGAVGLQILENFLKC